MGLQRFPLSNFLGGLNTKDSPFSLDNGEAQSLLNVSLSARGVLAQRSGKTLLDSAGFPATRRAEHIRPWYANAGATKTLMCSIDGDVYTCSPAGVLARIFDGFSNRVWCFEQGQDVNNVDTLWMMNQTNAPQKWNGADPTTATWANSPPNGSMMRLWHNKMCIAGTVAFPQRLYVSDIGNPESPSAAYGSSFIDIKGTEDDLDPITWLEVLGDWLLVFKKQSVWKVFNPATLENVRLGNPGCEDRFQSAVLHGRCYFFNRSGLWSTDGQFAPRYESVKIENFLRDNLNFNELSRVRVCAGKDRKLFTAVPFGASAFNNRLLEFIPDLIRVKGVDPQSGSWLVHDYTCASLANFRIVNTDELVAGDSNLHALSWLFHGTNDYGQAIKSHWWTAWRSLISEEPFERIRRVNMEMNGAVKLEVFSDFKSAPNYSTLISTITDPDALWNGGLWDGGVWNPVENTQLMRARPESRGRYHSIRLSNELLDRGFSIYAVELALRGGKEH